MLHVTLLSLLPEVLLHLMYRTPPWIKTEPYIGVLLLYFMLARANPQQWNWNKVINKELLYHNCPQKCARYSSQSTNEICVCATLPRLIWKHQHSHQKCRKNWKVGRGVVMCEGYTTPQQQMSISVKFWPVPDWAFQGTNVCFIDQRRSS